MFSLNVRIYYCEEACRCGGYDVVVVFADCCQSSVVSCLMFNDNAQLARVMLSSAAPITQCLCTQTGLWRDYLSQAHWDYQDKIRTRLYPYPIVLSSVQWLSVIKKEDCQKFWALKWEIFEWFGWSHYLRLSPSNASFDSVLHFIVVSCYNS